VKSWKKIIGFFIFALASARLMREAYFHSTDLHVYWKSAHLWLNGIDPYLYSSSDGGNVYKYPPWTIPLFLPLGLISFELTRSVWVIAEIVAIAYVVRWVVRTGASRYVTWAVAALFWWTWLGHVFAGQFSIFMMCAALWAVPPEEDRELSPAKASFLAVVFSSKVYSVFTLLGLLRTYLKKRTLLICLCLVIFLEALVFVVLWARGNPVSFLKLHQNWIVAAKSGAAELHSDVIRGPGNHSFTAALLRLFHVDALDAAKDVYVALGLGLFFSALWFHFSKPLSRAERWVGWIGVGMVIHPLLWHHSIVMAFPLCALAVDRAIRSKNGYLIGISCSSVFLVAVLIPNLFGPDFVNPFELLGSKSWGIFLAAVVLGSVRRIDSTAPGCKTRWLRSRQKSSSV
jgi:hypothetical protein